MAKTAEEIFNEHMVQLDHTFIEEDFCIGEKEILVASHKAFAAQEVEAYKERLRAAICYADDDGSSRFRDGMMSVLDLIDAVK